MRAIFQPGEEMGRGAQTLIEQGVLDGVQSIFGIHAVPLEPAGQISVAAGPIQASNDSFTITVAAVAYGDCRSHDISGPERRCERSRHRLIA